MPTQQLSPMEGLLIRGGMYQVLAVAYFYPAPAQGQRLADLIDDLSPWVGLASPEWSQRLARLRETYSQAGAAEAEVEFNRLFSGAMACSPLETSYEPDIFRKQHTLADIAGFYRAFGFQLPEATRWQQDHMGVELEFCAILLQRAGFALNAEGNEQAATCVDALRSFLADHLGRWSKAFADDLGKTADLPFYQELAGFTQDWVEIELQALGVEPDRLKARQQLPADLEAPTCGGCSLSCGPEGPSVPCPSGASPSSPASGPVGAPGSH